VSRPIQITDAEWEVMKVLWQTPGLTANEVAEQLTAATGWHGKTVRTLLGRLQKKKVVQATVVDRLLRFRPRHSRDECVSAASTSFLTRVFDGSFSPMMVHFVRNSPLSKKDQAELERILSKYNKEK